METKRNRILNIIICFVLFLFLALLIFRCFLAVWYPASFIPDGFVFKYIGAGIVNGEMPYLDSFDHKGPLVYILNYLGVLIDIDIGIIIVETVFNAVSLILMYYFPRRFGCDKLQSLLIAIIAGTYYLTVFGTGNFVEEFALPFISVSLIIFCDYFKTGKTTSLRVFICGFSFGFIMMLRANMGGLWAVMCIAVLIRSIKEKEYKCLFGFVMKFIAGAFTIILPLIVWLYCKGALSAFADQYIMFNLTYSDADFFLRSMAMVELIKQPVMIASFAFSIMWLLILNRNKKPVPAMLFAYLFFLIVQSLLIVMAGTMYDHYYILAVPFILIPISGFILDVSDHKLRYLSVTVIFFLIFLGVSIVNTTAKVQNASELNKMTDGVISAVRDNSREEDKIIMFGNLDYIYLKTERRASTKYSYTKPIIYLDKDIYDDYFNELEKHVPRILVIEFANDAIKDFINRHSYYIINESKRFIAYKTDE